MQIIRNLLGFMPMKGWLICSALSLLVGVWQALIPPVYQVNVVIFPEQEANAAAPLNNLLGIVNPTASSGTGTLKAILGSAALRNQLLKDSININDKSQTINDWLKEDYLERNLILSILQPPPASGESLRTFGHRYLNRNLIVFVDEEGFISVKYKSANQNLTLALSNQLLIVTKKLHQHRQWLRNQQQLEYLNFRADSLYKELLSVSKTVAEWGDKQRFTAKYGVEVNLKQLLQQQAVLEQLYTAVAVMKEEATQKVRQEAPLFQILDPPAPPFEVITSHPILFAILTFLLVCITLWVWSQRSRWLSLFKELL
jgi:hypothetical protein